MSKVTFSISDETLDDLDRLGTIYHLERSGVIAALARAAVKSAQAKSAPLVKSTGGSDLYRKMWRDPPETPQPADVSATYKKMWGDSERPELRRVSPAEGARRMAPLFVADWPATNPPKVEGVGSVFKAYFGEGGSDE